MALSAKTQKAKKGGRPVEADPEAILQVALRLFDKKGFDAVTMDEVAKAAEVGRRTLFRLFPSKSDLVWAGLRDVLSNVQARAAAVADAKLSLHEVVDRLFLSTLRGLREPRHAALARRRLRLIARTPGLLNQPVLQEIEAVVATAVAASSLPKRMPPGLAARAVVATVFAALLWWAEQDDASDPLEIARTAMQAVALAGER